MNGDSGRMVAPSGVVTFLFTDIEGSTRRWEVDAHAMRAALAVHDDVLRNRAARVMSAGHGGQILLDGVTADLLGASELIDLGPKRLRDIVKPVKVFQAQAPGLRAAFPPLKTLDSTPGNLRRGCCRYRRVDSRWLDDGENPCHQPRRAAARRRTTKPPRRSSDFAATTFALAVFPEITATIAHLREVLGDNVYEALAHAGGNMTNASAAQYALEQIERARGALA